MATINWPSDDTVDFSAYSEGLQFDVQISTSRAGRISTRTLPGARWVVSATVGSGSKAAGAAGRGACEALFARLRGGGNVLALWHPRKAAPLGTLRGSPTVAVAAAIGATSASITTTNGATVKAGDLLGLGGQRVMVVADATASGSTLAVTFEPALRVALAVGAAVVWDKPTSLFVPKEPLIQVPYRGSGLAGGEFDLELLEV